MMHRACRRFVASLCLLALAAMAVPQGSAEDKAKPLVIPLAPFGLPKHLFGDRRPLTCFHMHTAGTRLFWLDSTHIFVAFTTNAPCTFKSQSDSASLRGIVFDTTGAKIASRDWTLEGDFTLFPGPNHSIVLWQGKNLEFLDDHFQVIESGELAEKPRGLYITPARRTIPLLSADGRNFEFYSADPLKLLTTIPLDQSTEMNAVEDWLPGDERVAGVRCKDKSVYTCDKIFILTPDANFIAPDGAPWSYEEAGKPVSLHPVGFLDSTHLLISREDKNFFHSPQVFVVRPDGSKTHLPAPGGEFFIHHIAGVADGGSRFGLEYTVAGPCEDCISARRYVVVEMDSQKFLFDRISSPFFSRFELSPDGKSAAVLEDGALTLYPLKTHQ
jgi:hypothetical protein